MGRGVVSPFETPYLKKVSPKPPAKKYLLFLYYETKLGQFL